jgi:hypothetical protein
MEKIGNRTQARVSRINSIDGVTPPIFSEPHNSIRAAPPRSAATARSTLSTEISTENRPLILCSQSDVKFLFSNF